MPGTTGAAQMRSLFSTIGAAPMSKPGDFFVGILDFFAILVPGAIATAILQPRFGHLVFGQLIAHPPSEAGQWVAFLVFAYFIGHLIFQLGTYIDRLYNLIRERLNPYGNESAYRCATRLRDELIEPEERIALNTFQWARAVLISSSPAAADDASRLEADSKFFRSLLVVSLLASAVFATGGHLVEAAVALLLVAPCFARYCERRLKSTTQAYIHVVALHRIGRLAKASAAGPA